MAGVPIATELNILTDKPGETVTVSMKFQYEIFPFIELQIAEEKVTFSKKEAIAIRDSLNILINQF